MTESAFWELCHYFNWLIFYHQSLMNVKFLSFYLQRENEELMRNKILDCCEDGLEVRFLYLHVNYWSDCFLSLRITISRADEYIVIMVMI